LRKRHYIKLVSDYCIARDGVFFYTFCGMSYKGVCVCVSEGCNCYQWFRPTVYVTGI